MKSLIVLCLTLLIVGCSTSYDTLRGMRRISGDREAASEQDKLMNEFAAGGQTPQWRAEAMKTMAHLDFEFMHQTQRPAMHKKLVGLLKREYLTPRCERGSSPEERYKLRSWSIHALNLCDQAKEIDFFASVLEERNSHTDPEFSIRMAAMDGILARKKELALDAGIRRKVMSASATLKNEVKPRAALTPAAKTLLDAIMQLESNLLSYEDSVALLPEKAIDYTDPGQIMQIMSWCERGIVMEKAADTHPTTYAENVRKLLVMVEHPKLRLRRRARRMLSLYEPMALFSCLERRNSTGPLDEVENVKDLIYMIGRLDTMKASMSDETWARYQKTRKGVFERFFAAMEKYPLSVRDFVTSRLILVDLELFTDLCAKHALAFKKETPKNAHVYARNLFFGLVKSTGKNAAITKKLVGQLASFAQSPYLPTRRLVAHALYQSHPEELILANVPMFDQLKDWDPVKTDELLDAYLAALLELEKDSARLKRFKGEFTQSTKKSIYQPLADTLAQRVESTNAKLAEYLRDRAPDVFLKGLTTVMTAKPQTNADRALRETILLGDFALMVHTKIKPETLAAVSNTLTRGIVGKDEETALLCARYVLELGQPIDARVLKAAPLAVKGLNALKSETLEVKQ